MQDPKTPFCSQINAFKGPSCRVWPFILTEKGHYGIIGKTPAWQEYPLEVLKRHECEDHIQEPFLAEGGISWTRNACV